MELDIGKHCQHKECNLKTFLPFKCDGCSKEFCKDHRSYATHNCTSPKQDKNMVNIGLRVTCPLCQHVMYTPMNKDPNEIVSDHISKGCKINITTKKKSAKQKCSYSGCKKREFCPAKCSKCSHHYCTRHRYYEVHGCAY